MRRESLVVCALTLLWLALPSTAGAQERAGFWGGFGGGWGSARVTAAEIPDGDRAGSGVAHFRLGWTLSDRLLLGGEVDFWRKNSPLRPGVNANFNIYNVSGTLTYYPGASSRLFLKGGAGGSYLNIDYDLSGANVQVELGSGFGLILGTGYDIPLTPRVSLTPAVNLWHGRLGTLEYQGTPLFTEWKQNVFDITLGLTFH
jgi:hypothetical protein